MQIEAGPIDLERADRAHVQVWKIARHLAVNPVFHFTIVLSRCVGVNHQLVAVPTVALRNEHWVGFEVRILIRVGKPFSLVSDGRIIRLHGSIRKPVVAKL